MTQSFAIRCTPADREWPSYLVTDGTGEVRWSPRIEDAISEAIDLQDRGKSNVSYTVKAGALAPAQRL